MRMSKAKSASRCDRGFAAGRLFDDEAVIAEPLGNRLAQRVLVVDDQEMLLAVRHLEGGGILTPPGGPVNPPFLRSRSRLQRRARPSDNGFEPRTRQPTPARQYRAWRREMITIARRFRS